MKLAVDENCANKNNILATAGLLLLPVRLQIAAWRTEASLNGYFQCSHYREDEVYCPLRWVSVIPGTALAECIPSWDNFSNFDTALYCIVD